MNQALIFSVGLSLLWGISFIVTIREWREVKARPGRTRAEVVRAFRSMLKSWCLFILPFASVVYLALQWAGIGTETIRLLAYFTLAGSNFIGAAYAVISLRYD